MPLRLFRIDDRLVHGQVVVGWGKPLNLGFIVLVDDTVAGSDWERDLYRMGVPAEIELIFATVAEAIAGLPAWRADPRNGIVLTGEIAPMAALSRAAPPIPEVNVGGLHHRPGRTPRLSYVFLTDEELSQLRGIAAGGTTVVAQDLPTSSPVPLTELA